MARTLKAIAVNDSLSHSKKVGLIWNIFETTTKKIRTLFDTELLSSYNKGYSDLVGAMKNAEKKGYSPKYGLPSDAKKSVDVAPGVKQATVETIALLSKQGYKAINALIASILTRDCQSTKDGIRTKELNDFVVYAGQIAGNLEICAYAASRGRVAI